MNSERTWRQEAMSNGRTLFKPVGISLPLGHFGRMDDLWVSLLDIFEGAVVVCRPDPKLLDTLGVHNGLRS